MELIEPFMVLDFDLILLLQLFVAFWYVFLCWLCFDNQELLYRVCIYHDNFIFFPSYEFIM